MPPKSSEIKGPNVMPAVQPWPALSLAEAHARLTAPGSRFETVAVTVRGRPMAVWKHMPATAREAFLAARAHGARECLVYEDQRVTYEGLARAALVVAAELGRRGLQKGDRVAIAMRNLPEWVAVFFGALLAGGIAVPLNAWWTAAEMDFALGDSGARFLFADGERWARLAPFAHRLDQAWVARGEGPALLEDIIGTPARWSDLPEGVLPDIAPEPEDDATIFYTSGTGGPPKGALGTHRSLTINIPATSFSLARSALRAGHAPPDPANPRVTLVAVPFFHVTGCMSILLPNLAGGGKLVLMRRFKAEAAMALIEREKVTVTGGVPAVALGLLEHPARAKYDLSSLALVTYGGAPAGPQMAARVRRLLGAEPGQGWGMTETSATCTTHAGADYLRRPESCGPALPIYRLKVTDAAGRELPPGEVGELWAYGANVVKGYWNRPEETAATFRDGWVRTGDLARLDGEGFCFILDRAKDMLIRGGENIYCSEVESALCDHPAVCDAAVVGLPHPLLGEEPGAVVQLRPGMAADADSLRDFLAPRLAPFKLPVRLVLGEAPLPRNANGKVVKRDLRKLFA